MLSPILSDQENIEPSQIENPSVDQGGVLYSKDDSTIETHYEPAEEELQYDGPMISAHKCKLETLAKANRVIYNYFGETSSGSSSRTSYSNLIRVTHKLVTSFKRGHSRINWKPHFTGNNIFSTRFSLMLDRHVLCQKPYHLSARFQEGREN